MNPPSEDAKDMLEAESSLGLEFGTNLFIGEVPEGPDELVALFDPPGQDEEANYVYERPSLQARIRGEKGAYQAAYALAESVKNLLKTVSNDTWNSTRYVQIWVQGTINWLGYDKNHRPEFSVNFRIHRTTG